MYRLVKDNEIKIGNHSICFPSETKIDKVLNSKIYVWFNTCPTEKDLDWNKIETHQIWRKRCDNNPSELFCFNSEGILKWKFAEQRVVGFGKVIPESKKEEDFITPEHYKNYIEKYKGMELLEVYAGNFRYVLNTETGEIYDRMESR